jgi:hypothetical protein
MLGSGSNYNRAVKASGLRKAARLELNVNDELIQRQTRKENKVSNTEKQRISRNMEEGTRKSEF